MAEITSFSPDSTPSFIPPLYSQISLAPLSPTHQLLHISGQTGTSPATTPETAPPFAEQVKIALGKIDACLAGAGATKANITLMRMYVVKLASLDPKDTEALMRSVVGWWRSTEGERKPPAQTMVGVESLFSHETAFEVEVVGVVAKAA